MTMQCDIVGLVVNMEDVVHILMSTYICLCDRFLGV